jgi:hypothetical protein
LLRTDVVKSKKVTFDPETTLKFLNFIKTIFSCQIRFFIAILVPNLPSLSYFQLEVNVYPEKKGHRRVKIRR